MFYDFICHLIIFTACLLFIYSLYFQKNFGEYVGIIVMWLVRLLVPNEGNMLALVSNSRSGSGINLTIRFWCVSLSTSPYSSFWLLIYSFGKKLPLISNIIEEGFKKGLLNFCLLVISFIVESLFVFLSSAEWTIMITKKSMVFCLVLKPPHTLISSHILGFPHCCFSS